MELVRIGRLGRAHGVRGELTLEGSALSATELQAIQSFTWRGRGGATLALTLETARPAHERVLVHFAGYDDRDRARELTTGELLAERERLPDPGPGLAYTFQLIGLEVRTAAGRKLGTLEEVISTGANPIYVVRGEREWLVPAAPGVVQQVDLAAGTLTVELPAGLEDLPS
ncbi:MAG TPA: ribosome maturation factor RimM [Candidatus Eisenbacteria bacterium]|jgi:16S rRNA processing protein RimM